jgi:hypothetical protein
MATPGFEQPVTHHFRKDRRMRGVFAVWPLAVGAGVLLLIGWYCPALTTALAITACGR